MPERLRRWYGSAFGHALVGAALLWAAFPPLDAFGLWPLAWIAPAWWVLLVRRAQLAGKRPYVWLWLAGFLFWMAALYWLSIPNVYTAVGWVALSFYLGFYLPVFIGLSRVAVHRLRVPVIVAAPVVWTGLELARGHLLTGFTMASLGHTQYRWIALIQLADLAGAYGVGFVVMFVAACLGRIVPCDARPRSSWPLAPLVLVLGAAVLYGHLRMSKQTKPHQARAKPPQARIALIQGAIDTVLNPEPGMRARMHRQYWALSRAAVRQDADLDLVIWPESVWGATLVDFPPEEEPNIPVPDAWDGSEQDFRLELREAAFKSQGQMRAAARELGTPMLVGVGTQFFDAEGVKRFNSAAFVPLDEQPMSRYDKQPIFRYDEQRIPRYDKMHRVAFGEYMPFAEELSGLVDLTPLNSLGLTVDPGTEPAAFALDGLHIAPNICYESVMPHVIRGQVNTLARRGQEPDVLVNLTNDGWFWGSSELDMHLVCGVFRAVECRKPFLIAANTGFSAWIDADGRIVARGPRRATGTILAEVGPDRRSSLYLRHGDWPAGLCLAACLVFGAVGLWDRFRGGRKTGADPGRTRQERRPRGPGRQIARHPDKRSKPPNAQ